ncbi:MAG: hypothetical protein K8I01_08725 [Candidatus Methylomirabilis sp.]|nr:hypothetical protein [Deltaproteobacteria bacterium]
MVVRILAVLVLFNLLAIDNAHAADARSAGTKKPPKSSTKKQSKPVSPKNGMQMERPTLGSGPWKLGGCASFKDYKTGASELQSLKSEADRFAAELEKSEETLKKLESAQIEIEQAKGLPEGKREAELKRLEKTIDVYIAELEPVRLAAQSFQDSLAKRCPESEGISKK